jgi:hypothetical protein
MVGLYTHGWTPSPGPARVADRSGWPKLHQYVADVIGSFREDRRVVAWDLFNEPQSKSLPLVRAVLGWARQARPSQPVTVDVWARQHKDINVLVFADSDVITFHNHGPAQAMTDEINSLSETGRPLICSEWMAPETGATIANILPILYDRHVGAFIWGLVNGKTQTNYHWGAKAGSAPPAVWQQDILHGDLTPYDPDELASLQKYQHTGISWATVATATTSVGWLRGVGVNSATSPQRLQQIQHVQRQENVWTMSGAVEGSGESVNLQLAAGRGALPRHGRSERL